MRSLARLAVSQLLPLAIPALLFPFSLYGPCRPFGGFFSSQPALSFMRPWRLVRFLTFCSAPLSFQGAWPLLPHLSCGATMAPTAAVNPERRTDLSICLHGHCGVRLTSVSPPNTDGALEAVPPAALHSRPRSGCGCGGGAGSSRASTASFRLACSGRGRNPLPRHDPFRSSACPGGGLPVKVPATP